MAFWKGQAVTEINTECGDGNRTPPTLNHLSFQAAGVTGAGAYGPLESSIYAGHRLPKLSWQLPRTWETSTLSSSCVLGFRSLSAYVEATDETSCQFEIREGPGHFSLRCTSALWRGDGSAGGEATGEVELEADCDVRTR